MPTLSLLRLGYCCCCRCRCSELHLHVRCIHHSLLPCCHCGCFAAAVLAAAEVPLLRRWLLLPLLQLLLLHLGHTATSNPSPALPA